MSILSILCLLEVLAFIVIPTLAIRSVKGSKRPNDILFRRGMILVGALGVCAALYGAIKNL